MTTTAEINSQFFGLINREVQRVADARRTFPPSVVESSILPGHEKQLNKLIAWRNLQLNRVHGFAGYLTPQMNQQRRIQGYVRGFAVVPPSATKAFNQAYNAQAAVIKANYQAALRTNSDQYNTTVAQLKSLLNQQLVGSTAQQKKAYQANYTAGVAATRQAKNQADAGAKATQQQALANLLNNLTAHFSNTSVFNPPASTNPLPGTTIVASLPPDLRNIGSGYGYSPTTGLYYDPMGNPVSYQQMQASLSTAFNQVGGAGGQSGGAVTSGVTSYTPPPDYPQYDDSQVSWGDIPLWPSYGDSYAYAPTYSTTIAPAYDPGAGGTSLPSTSPQAVSPVPDASLGQLDVFGGGDSAVWGWGFGCSPSITGDSVLGRINRAGCLPVTAYGFSQWAQIVTAVAQAGAQIGSAALTARLTPRPTSPRVTNVAPVVGGANYTPWLIGGAAVLGAILVFKIARRR